MVCWLCVCCGLPHRQQLDDATTAQESSRKDVESKMEEVRAELLAAKASRKAGSAAAKGFGGAGIAEAAAANAANAAPAKRGRKKSVAKSPEAEAVSASSNQQQ
jgi:hypothetical protein